VHARYVWSGRSASTSDFLGRLARWRSDHAVQYAFHMRGLSDIATGAAEAVMHNGAADFIEAASAYARALQSFGAESGLEIYSPEHLALVELAHTAGVHYKSCGAAVATLECCWRWMPINSRPPKMPSRAQDSAACAGDGRTRFACRTQNLRNGVI